MRIKGEGKDIGRDESVDSCYSSACIGGVSEVTADLHELMAPQWLMPPSINRANAQLDPWYT